MQTLLITGEELVPNYMISCVGNVMEIVLSEVNLTAAEEAVANIQLTAVDLSRSVTHLGLQTQVIEEAPVVYDSGMSL